MLVAKVLWPRSLTIPYWVKYFNVIGIFLVSSRVLDSFNKLLMINLFDFR